MKGESKHAHFCFAGQPAPCKGYFPDDVLPCVCGAEGDIVTALSQVAVPAPLGGMPVPADLAPVKPEAVKDEAACPESSCNAAAQCAVPHIARNPGSGSQPLMKRHRST